ncbi:MAG: N-acetylneuraminate synthase [Bacteroidia bacterium]|nr:N-acetylneuraminate synthase [Bacteroidia bacterium]
MLPQHKPYIIGETAFHHEGDLDFLNSLIAKGEELGFDALKFHVTVDLDDYMVANHEAIDVIRPWCFNEEEWDKILSNIKKTDIILLCNDLQSIKYANSCQYPIRALEIHATGLNDVFLLEEASKFKGTVILGTGGSTLDEIEFAIQFLIQNGHDDIFLMHGFQNYPTDVKDIKLERMEKLQALFNLPIGYADHTDPNDKNNAFISCLGIARGFNILEKHFTTNFGEKRIDAQAAINENQINQIKELATIIYNSLGSDNPLEMSTAELKYGNTGPMKKAIVASKDLNEGDKLALNDIAFKRTNIPAKLKQNQLQLLLGLTLTKSINKDEIIDLEAVNYEFQPQDISQFKNTK